MKLNVVTEHLMLVVHNLELLHILQVICFSN